MSNSHYFIGFPVREDLKNRLEIWQKQLRKKADYKVWTFPDDFHITVKFLGDCADNTLEELLKNLESQDWPSVFSETIGPIGNFGSNVHPRVVHAKVSKSDRLSIIKQQVEEAGVKAGLDREKRPYSPHITLAKKWVSGTPLEDGSFPSVFREVYHQEISHLTLYRIHPARKPKYEVVAELPLHKKE
ncbi:RNA 2',3'-cyclic phosphodiesterase [Halobacillus rhizosphaerae]|uniref:RNA 2',3'-cyclic phosphodiesterase n=1 Tax=Halobacillus rhizosphaerae TaxID=3064889 RepID=UPI00398B38F3